LETAPSFKYLAKISHLPLTGFNGCGKVDFSSSALNSTFLTVNWNVYSLAKRYSLHICESVKKLHIYVNAALK